MNYGFNDKKSIKVGDVFFGVWGHAPKSDFYEVIEKKFNAIIVRKLKAIGVARDNRWTFSPIKGEYLGEPIRRPIKHDKKVNGWIYIQIDNKTRMYLSKAYSIE